uniref:Reverse transcriptase domain-containing protein n=1 Tax=Lactuca sativa TaxID=4236 RepID=A0A9R1W5X0_LACSA|nr:hypothetical protein LSAT_V11C300135570 [Lactuca sativa]
MDPGTLMWQQYKVKFYLSIRKNFKKSGLPGQNSSAVNSVRSIQPLDQKLKNPSQLKKLNEPSGRGDIMEFVKYFEKYGTLDRGCNSSFITLVPKIKDPLHIGDYRPISLIGSLYKIISKALANRLSMVIGKNIGEAQSAFVKGRNILDGPMIVNELCTWAKKVKKQILLFKVDLEKAFDFVNWEYLESILIQMGYGDKWPMWMKGCLQSARLSVLINGSPTVEFDMEKGLFQGLKIPNTELSISHLLYADAAIFVGVWNNIAEVANELTKVWISFRDILKKKVKNGNDTLFRMDEWCDGEPLKDQFPELYQLERRKACRISQRVQVEGYTWQWRSTPATGSQTHSFQMLYEAIGEYRLSPDPESWICPLSDDGIFHVEEIKLRIDNIEPTINEVIIPWLHDIPIKVNTFIVTTRNFRAL